MLTKSRSLAPVFTDGHQLYSPFSTSSVVFYDGMDVEGFLRAERARARLIYTRTFSGPVGTEIFSSSRRPKPFYNACMHDKFQFVCRPVTYVFVNKGKTFGTEYYKYPSPISKIPDNFDHLETDVELAANRAWWTMQPKFDGEISMLNFLYELKDFRDIAKYATKLDLTWLDGIVSQLFRDLRRLGKAALSTKTPAVIALMNNFAIQPLIKDLSSIMYQIGTCVRDAEKQFALAGEGLQKSHYTELLGVHSDLTAAYVTPKNQYAGEYWKTTFTATLSYKYKYTMRGKCDRFLTYWGLKGTWEAYWNMLPFSFLADYWLGVGKSLRAMERDPSVSLYTDQYCESLLTTGGAGYFFVPTGGTSKGMILENDFLDHTLPVLVSGASCSRYERVPTSPSKGLFVPKTKWPNSTQWINMLALTRCFL